MPDPAKSEKRRKFNFDFAILQNPFLLFLKHQQPNLLWIKTLNRLI